MASASCPVTGAVRGGGSEAGDEDVVAAVRGAVVGVLAVRPGVRERLAAARAPVGLLTAVQSTVLGQVMLVLEGALTDAARERTQTYQHRTEQTTGSALVSEDEDTGNSNPKNGRH